MKRRELVAAVGSLGVFAAGGTIAVRGLPFQRGGGGSEAASTAASDGPIEVETVDAPGSEAGTLTVPAADRPTLVSFFVTSCGNCQAQVPRLAAARSALDGGDVRFLSASYQSPRTLPADELAEWWDRLGGAWAVGYDDGLSRRYGLVGYPITVIVDTDGTLAWRSNGAGVLSADEIVSAVESVTDDGDGDDAGSGEA